jgi:hypothetical protein
MPATFRETLNAILQSKVADPAAAIAALLATVNWHFPDNIAIYWGTGNDFRIYHDGTNNLLRTDNGNIQLLFGAASRVHFSATGGAGAAVNIALRDSSPTTKAFLAVADANGDITSGSLAGDLTLRAENEQILFTTDAGTTTKLTLLTGTGAAVFSVPVRLKGYTVAGLPAGTQGDTAFVTNALAPAYGVAVAGGGAVVVPVFYNGAAWICA